jgi:WD40 repeat protein
VLGEGAILDGSGEVVEPPKLSAIDLSTSEEVWEISLGVLPGFITLSPDGSKAAVSEGGNASGKVEIWDLVTQTRLAHFNHPDAQALPWSKDGTRVALSGNNADITIIEEALGWAPSMILTGQRSSVWGTAFHPDGTLLAAASHDGETVIWDVTAEGAVGTDAVALGSPIGMFYLGPDDQLVAGTDAAGGMIVDLATGQTRATIPGVDPFSFPPNDRFTVAAAMSRDVNDSQSGRLIDLRNGETIVDLGCRIPLATDSDARRVVLEPDRPCRGPSEVRDLETDEVIVDLGSQGSGKAVFSPEAFDGPPYVAVFPGGLEIYSLDDRELVASYTTDDFGITAFLTMSVDPEGRYLGIGTNGPDSIVIDMEAVMAGTPKMEAVVFDMVGNKTNATQFRVTSDGIGASSSFDPIYRVWDITTDEFLFEIKVDPLGDVGAVQFSHDGTQLAYEDAGGVIRFSPLDDEAVVAKAEAVVTRSLSDDECRRYLHTDGCVTIS